MKRSNANNGQTTDDDDDAGLGTETTEAAEPGDGPEGQIPRQSGVYVTSRPPPPPEDEAQEDGEPRTIEEMFRAHWASVIAVFARPDIGPDSREHMTLEVFITMDRYLQSHERPADVPAFLATLAINKLRNRARVRRRRPVFVDVGDCYELSAGADPEQLLMEAQSARMLDTLLDAMPPDDSRLLRWVEIDETSEEHIAAVLEVPSATVRSRLRRARIRFYDMAQRARRRLGGDW